MNSIVHFEIPTDDISRAGEFYKGVFGWDVQEFPMPDGPYFMANTTPVGENHRPTEPGAINGGLFPRQKPGETPILVINVESIEEHHKKVEAAGGKVVSEVLNIGGMGLYSRFQDPEGNIMGLWQTL